MPTDTSHTSTLAITSNVDSYVASTVGGDDTCPDSPITNDPNALCPFDPDTYYLWMGDDADAPLWTHCNYDSGSTAVPCPHDPLDDSYYYARCNDTGEVWEIIGSKSDPTNVEQACPNGYTVL